MNDKVKLNNIFFAPWLILYFPIIWIFIIPINFIYDLILLLLILFILDIKNKKIVIKKSLIKIFLFGTIVNVIGACFIYLTKFLPGNTFIGESIKLGIKRNPFFNIYSLIYIIIIFILLGVLLYYLNYNFTFQKIENNNRKKICFLLAIFMIPYFFLLPTEKIFNIKEEQEPVGVEYAINYPSHL